MFLKKLKPINIGKKVKIEEIENLRKQRYENLH